jgi:hypothetical protein
LQLSRTVQLQMSRSSVPLCIATEFHSGGRPWALTSRWTAELFTAARLELGENQWIWRTFPRWLHWLVPLSAA